MKLVPKLTHEQQWDLVLRQDKIDKHSDDTKKFVNSIKRGGRNGRG